MPSSWSPSLRLELQFTGENINLWGEKLNTALAHADRAIAGWTLKPLTGPVTLSTANGAADEARSATLKFTPEEQEFRRTLAPEAFAPTPDAWGRQGWTRATLAALSEAELAAALEVAWRTAQAKPARRPRKRA